MHLIFNFHHESARPRTTTTPRATPPAIRYLGMVSATVLTDAARVDGVGIDVSDDEALLREDVDDCWVMEADDEAVIVELGRLLVTDERDIILNPDGKPPTQWARLGR